MNNVEELLKYIDVDWVKENPKQALDLILVGKKELDSRKDVIQEQEKSIQVLRQRVLLLNALLMDKEEEEKDGNN